MANATEWIRHDAGARNDIKVEAMTIRYGMAGYGMYWVVVEALRQTTDYKLPMKAYVWAALASRMMCTPEQAEEYVRSCIDEFELFASDDDRFWSDSLLRRMAEYDALIDQKREAGKLGAEARRDKGSSAAAPLQQRRSTATAAPQQRSSDVEAPPEPENGTATAAPKLSLARDCIDSRECKEEEHAPKVKMRPDQYETLCSQYGKGVVDTMIASISDHLLSKGKAPYKDSAAAVRQWLRRDGIEPRSPPTRPVCPDCGKPLIDNQCRKCKLIVEDSGETRRL